MRNALKVEFLIEVIRVALMVKWKQSSFDTSVYVGT